MPGNWLRIGKALDSELESFDSFMTGRSIEGEEAETLPDEEIRKIESILEKPLPDKIVQEKLLEEHMKHHS
ncbi:hypothetical protein [Candidatus Nanohalobium constans]|uniref:Uncharacterized protein n=1 Tax=Candidatus Nanohalobium constans TaxID=2565781 RepID=A0A5Q0UHL1_9ARCH|nr:hypothetical protein [Candidatus Nanohalobium constans]QGA80841.1 hypothetical protein LC1Nh_0960 [Candidatus Nanohalobium constans]